jgi:outer membrane protein TolC
MNTRNTAHAVVLISILVGGTGTAAERQPKNDAPSISAGVIAGIGDRELVQILREVLERNPEIEAARARAEGAALRPYHAGVLPNPQVDLTAYLLPPETRVGPQRLSARVSQRLPGFARLRLEEQASVHDADSGLAELEALKLRLLTDARRHYHEVVYLDAAIDIICSDRAILDHFEELARMRYASGVGLQKDALQIQAEITRLDARLADLEGRRAVRAASINRLRSRTAAPVHAEPIDGHAEIPANRERLRAAAIRSRPELAALEARVMAARTRQKAASKSGRPEFNVGLTYALVDRRDDADPPDNGRDVFGLTGGITLPVWRKAIAAETEEATHRRLAAEAELRDAVAAIDFELEALLGRIPEIERQLELFTGVLLVQTEQALRSAEAAYAAGRVDGLALLDAERVLLDVRLSTERARADLAIALAELEGVVGAPLKVVVSGEPGSGGGSS